MKDLSKHRARQDRAQGVHTSANAAKSSTFGIPIFFGICIKTQILMLSF